MEALKNKTKQKNLSSAKIYIKNESYKWTQVCNICNTKISVKKNSWK